MQIDVSSESNQKTIQLMRDIAMDRTSKSYQYCTCSVIQAMASMTRATTSERRTARNARFTDKASVVLPDEATAALFLIPAVSISRNFCNTVYGHLKYSGLSGKRVSIQSLFLIVLLSRQIIAYRNRRNTS